MPALVRELARAKVNLALHVLGRRADGYHELDSIVAFADIADELSITRSSKTSLEINGPYATEVAADDDNLVLKAYRALAKLIGLPPVRITLSKNLPVAAGLGGGSADAAATLRGLTKLLDAPVSQDRLHDIALTLGADVPACLRSRVCRMQGVGEILTDIENLPAEAIVLVNPNMACSTAAVFKTMGLQPGQAFRAPLVPDAPDTWRNDLEFAACQVAPAIAEVLIAMQHQEGLSHVRMSGSGATCFGLAASLAQAKAITAQIAKAYPQWWVRAATLG